MVKRRFGPVAAGALPFVGRKAFIGSIGQILLRFGSRFYQIIKRCRLETVATLCCAAEKKSVSRIRRNRVFLPAASAWPGHPGGMLRRTWHIACS